MKMIVLICLMFAGFMFALADSLSHVRYPQEVIYVNQYGERLPAPYALAAETAAKRAPQAKVKA
ncbi:hypothetical protein [Rufibacter roseus]|uniref:Uncharacterized protein n=1 Tax=Rufibacter roseus TaxID=1567108 RepID=A0ABW2DH73_9BACT|nr:hypothetical protein [Rufibacter roseus]